MQSLNISTIIVLTIVVLIVIFAIRRVKKRGGCNCGTSCGCSSCPSEKNIKNKIDLDKKKIK